MLIHPSSLGKIMAAAKSKKPEDLSVGAMTYCESLAKEFVYGYREELTSKYLDKGNLCEDQSIELYNEVHFTSHIKNEERKYNGWLTGECDINARDKIIDIKTSWSANTFPALKKDAHDKKYEWQGRAYMMLWDKDLFELAYCLVDTPTELIGFEDDSIHYVSNIDPELRVTTIEYKRDKALEELIKIKCEAAQAYIKQAIDIISNDHR